MNWPAAPGPGSHPLTLETPAFYLLVALLGVFAVLLWLLWRSHPRGRRGFEGYREAAGVDLAFLVFGVLLVLALVHYDPAGNATSYALYRVVLSGYWLTFAIPVVTVGSSIQSRTRGRVSSLAPSLSAAALFFAILFAFFYGSA